MDEFVKKPNWKTGLYSKLISETTKIQNEKIVFDKYLFFKTLDENKMVFSSYGFAYDLHKLYRNVPGKEKTDLMNNITSK